MRAFWLDARDAARALAPYALASGNSLQELEDAINERAVQDSDSHFPAISFTVVQVLSTAPIYVVTPQALPLRLASPPTSPRLGTPSPETLPRTPR